ncbi:hypothetical protein TNCV_527351 [Trichonephila clavipes]|nr:hypothetical protein TNCV_527351 [Trichonephila clavipes]
MSSSSAAATMPESQTHIPTSIAAPSLTNNMFTPSSLITSNSLCSSAPLSLMNETNISPLTRSKSDIQSSSVSATSVFKTKF